MNETAKSSKRFGVTLVGVCLLALAPACTKKAPTASVPVAVAAPVPAPSASAEAAATAHGARKLINLDAPVFVDGVARSVLRYGDLPVLPTAKSWNGTSGFRMQDYLKAIGVSLETVRAVQLYGNGGRVATILGSELRRDKERFVISFTAEDTGAPLARWNTDGLKDEFVIHEIRKVAVYEAKDAPVVNMETQCIVDANGRCTDVVPNVTGEFQKGTRIVVDGKIVGYVKRRLLTDAMIVGGKDETDRQYSVSALLSSFGIDLHKVKGIELLAGDDIVGRADAKRWEGIHDSLHFTIPPHSHGKVRAHVPATLQGSEKGVADQDGLITAMLVYKSSNVSARELHPITEATDVSVELAQKDTAPQND